MRSSFQKHVTSLLFLVLVLINLFMASWYVSHGDIHFSADIGRDFLLLQELDQKKIVLIGPRSSVSGIFHGPLWMYITYPGFVLGFGNPVVMGWYWIFLTSLFLISCFFIAKKLFDTQTAYLFVLMTSLYMVFHSHELFNPHGAMFVIPAVFYFFLRYIQTNNYKYLIAHILLIGALIQFQMAIGVPFFILSLLYVLYQTVKKHKTHARHLLAYALIFLSLTTFILFDIRHEFLMVKSALRHIQEGGAHRDMAAAFIDRTRVMVSGVEFLRFGLKNGSLYVFIAFAVFLFLQIKQKKHVQIYALFLYFYVGFFIISLINPYGLLYFYTFPLIPFVFLIFSSFITSQYKQLFLVLFFLIYVLNFKGALMHIDYANTLIGKSGESWKFLSGFAKIVYSYPEKDFGYFVYSPDVFGYAPKYAMDYEKKVAKENAEAFVKKPITYLVIAPPPKDNPYMLPGFWKEKQVNIDMSLHPKISSVEAPNGYRIERYELTEEETKVSFDPSINPGIHFR